MSDEEILGMDSVGQTLLSGPESALPDVATSGNLG